MADIAVISGNEISAPSTETIVPIVYEDSIGSRFRFRSETTIIVNEGSADVVKLEVEITAR